MFDYITRFKIPKPIAQHVYRKRINMHADVLESIARVKNRGNRITSSFFVN